MIKAVIFDMDGVVIDSEKYWPEANLKYLSGFIPDIQPEFIATLTGMGFVRPYDILKERYAFNVDRESFSRNWMEFGVEDVYPRAEFIPGVVDFIRSLRKTGQKTALATSSIRDIVNRVFVTQIGMESLFDAITSGDEVGARTKPMPDLFLKAAAKLNIDPKYCLVIEDADSGIAAAKAASMTVYGFRNGFNDHQSLKDADLIFQDFSKLTL